MRLQELASEQGGVFETLRVYGGVLFRPGAHLARLRESAKSLDWKHFSSSEALIEQIGTSLRKKRLKEAMVRVTAYASGGADVIAQAYNPYPEAWYRKGIRLCTVPTRRSFTGALDPRIKSANFLGGVLAKGEGILRGEEPFQLGAMGFAAEGTTFNIFMARERELVTPPVWSGLLEGVTRGVVKELAGEEGISLSETPLTRKDLFCADEVFITNTSMEVMPVAFLDGRRIGRGGPGPVTRRLRRAFQILVRRECGV